MLNTLALKTFIRRFLIKKLSLHRPTSWPYVTGDSFRSLAQHIYDESMEFDPKHVERGDVIFVRTNYLEDFFRNIMPGIPSPFILVTHNEDEPAHGKYVRFAEDEKVIHWFAENVMFKHPKVTAIPIGLANFYSRQNGSIAAFTHLQKNPMKKDKLILWSFVAESNPKERQEAAAALSKLEFAHRVRINNQIKYYRTLQEYKFIASPAGRGEDCNRAWEALYLNVIPIVKRSPMTESFVDMGIPMYLIDSWEQAELLTEEKLHEFYVENEQKLHAAPLYMEYWAAQIASHRG